MDDDFFDEDEESNENIDVKEDILIIKDILQKMNKKRKKKNFMNLEHIFHMSNFVNVQN